MSELQTTHLSSHSLGSDCVSRQPPRVLRSPTPGATATADTQIQQIGLPYAAEHQTERQKEVGKI